MRLTFERGFLPRGILSISWSQADPELLLSSAKDNRILCWNPATGEVIPQPTPLLAWLNNKRMRQATWSR